MRPLLPLFRPFPRARLFSFFFFNDTATTEIYTLSLHDALPIWLLHEEMLDRAGELRGREPAEESAPEALDPTPLCQERSEEHTSELQSPCNLVCRLLLEKKKASSTTRHR